MSTFFTLLVNFSFLQGGNYNNPGSNYYWSVQLQTCNLCPTDYTSGYGQLDNYYNSVTNRCYYVENTNALALRPAWVKCYSASAPGVPAIAAVTGYLFPVGTTFEFAMAAYWTNNIRNYYLWGWMFGMSCTPTSCTCANSVSPDWHAPGSRLCDGSVCALFQTLASPSPYWCTDIFYNGNIVSEPNNAGCTPGSVCECATTIVGNLGNCLNDVPPDSAQLYICEFGG